MILLLKSVKFNLLISIPSTIILPFDGSRILLKQRQIVLLPAPVLPTIPILSPLLTLKVRFLRTNGVSGLYLRLRSLKAIYPCSGQFGLFSSSVPASTSFSYGTLVMSIHLSALTI